MGTKTQVDPHELLKEHFGWPDFKPGQLDVVQRLLDGKSVLSVFPTGGGKSLCYQLPALAFDGLTIVVSPLIALMKDQIDQLSVKGIHAVRLDSSLAHDEYREAMSSIRNGSARLLYVAPERFFNERFRASLSGLTVSLFAIDEAHCISQWGHNFRPDYLKLGPIAKSLNVQRVLCLTATATPTVQDDICRAFDIKDEDVICTDFFRPNLKICTQIVRLQDQLPRLIEKLKLQATGATIVYVTLQKTAEKIAAACVEAGLDARPYHAGMGSEQRSEIQDWFMNEPDKIVVATIAFGMGIDKSDIRAIYHFNPPKSLENYAQEIGRAGRDGGESVCEMLLVPEDRVALENFVYGDTPSLPSIRAFVNEIDSQQNEFFISQYKLSSQCDIKPVVIKTLLTYLELDGFLESTSPRYDSYSFKPNVPFTEIIEYFSGERQQFVNQLLAGSRKRKIWFQIDIPETVEKSGSDRERVVKALDYFSEKGWIELRVSGLVHGYRKLKAFNSKDDIAAEFAERALRREEAEIKRTRQVVELARAENCQPGMLSEHFGQPLTEPCGCCSSCTGKGPFPVPEIESVELEPAILRLTQELSATNPDVLNCARSIARFLCGLTSPGLTKSKLSRHESFGICSGIPFDQVMNKIQSLKFETVPCNRNCSRM